MEVRDTCAHAVPATTSLHLDTWYLDDAHTRITLLLSSTHAAPRGPGCEVPARSGHSHYTRRLADLPWGGDASTRQLRVRQLFCSHTKCPRRVFTARRPGLVAPWARRTLRLMARLRAVALALGGAAGVRLSPALGLTVSRNPLWRGGRPRPFPAPPATGPRLSTVPLAPPQPSTRALALAATRRARRVATYEQV